MAKPASRLVNRQHLPSSLWDASTSTMQIPGSLAHAYLQQIKKYGLEKLAATREQSDSVVGGLSKSETDEHFAKKFDGSVARAQLALLDPEFKLFEGECEIFKRLVANNLLIIDAPCGAGAATLSWLCTVAQLRKECVVPRLPLYVDIIGAELSQTARQYARELLDSIKPVLFEQAIFVSHEFFEWDVLDDASHTGLVKKGIKRQEDEISTLIVVANFSGFLGQANVMKEAEKNIQEMIKYLSNDRTTALWIEPGTNDSKRVFRKVVAWLTGPLGQFASFLSNRNVIQEIETHYICPVDQYRARVRLRLVDLVLRGRQ